MVDGEEEQDWEKCECDPDGEGNEDGVDEAACWDGGGDVGVWALERG